jgi:NAD(P)H-dependent FMN reductase
MTRIPRIVAFAGSARAASFNKKLVHVAARAAREAGAEVTEIDLADYRMPVYDGDLEASDGLPEAALRLKELFTAHDGFLISTPEYNSSFTPLLKNTIDWTSRSVDGRPGLAWARGKTAAVLSTSPGALGGIRALGQLRALLEHIGMLVVPRQKALPRAREAFDDTGDITDDAAREAVEAVARDLVDITRRLVVSQS